jgi:acetoin utilization protein AcuB
MRIRDFMSTTVVAVDENTSVLDARKIMEAHKIRRLPVMRKDQLVGLVTERMLVEAEPLPAKLAANRTEDPPLLPKRVKDFMAKDPYTVGPDMPFEEALKIGQDMGYGGFPVVEDGMIVGMVTESDIMRLMTKAFGVSGGSKRIEIRTSREFGTMKKIMEVLDENKAVLLSLMTFLRRQPGQDLIILRVNSEDAGPVAARLKSSGFTVARTG